MILAKKEDNVRSTTAVKEQGEAWHVIVAKEKDKAGSGAVAKEDNNAPHMSVA